MPNPAPQLGKASLPAATPIRGTQSFVHTLSACWKQPSLTALEVAWRWLFGIPALALVYAHLHAILMDATNGTLDPAQHGLDKVFLNDPVGALSADPIGASDKLMRAIHLVQPGLMHDAVWILPLLLIVWIVVSSFGRTAVLRRADPTLHARPFTLMGLQAIRIVVLLAIFTVWIVALQKIAVIAVTGPIAAGADPNLVLYCALIIIVSLGMFTAWAFVSWVLSVAPLLAMLRNLGIPASLHAATRLGPLKAKLVEINLVMAIVKVALLVLAMVFSATPLPFQTVTSAGFLACWWAAVTVIYLVWSDFFHVARLVGYLNLWRSFADDGKGAT